MKTRRITLAFICAASLLSSVALARAWQEPTPQSGRIEVRRNGGGEIFISDQGEGTFSFVSTEMTFDGKVIKGAPFSAQTVSEHIQVLGDGNRIVNTNTGAIYRDSEGRTRREQQITSLGGLTADNAPTKMIMVHDPVAATNFTLNPANKTAMKHGNFRVQVFHDGGSPGEAGKVTATREPSGDVRVERRGPPPPPGAAGWSKAEVKTESLGKQVIEGVEADGTRTTRTIPAGAIGNDQAINIVSERWYSSELQTVIMTKHSDPRFGESTFRLTNIDRSEPAASLFQIPSDYTVTEGRPGPRLREEMRMRRGQPKDQ